MNIVRFLVMSVSLLISITVHAGQISGMPGDEFRKTAMDYEDNAAKAVKEATHAQGENIRRYLEVSSVYREMAAIKRNAASLGDQGRWDDISWDRYHELEAQRDELMQHLDWSYTRQQANQKKVHGNKTLPESGFTQAAKKYEEQAREAQGHAKQATGAQRDSFNRLAGIYQQMAGIKYEAAQASSQGKGYDWSRYHELETQRDQIKMSLKKSAH